MFHLSVPDLGIDRQIQGCDENVFNSKLKKLTIRWLLKLRSNRPKTVGNSKSSIKGAFSILLLKASK